MTINFEVSELVGEKTTLSNPEGRHPLLVT